MVRGSVSEAKLIMFLLISVSTIDRFLLLRHTCNIQNSTSKSGVGANIAEHAILSLAEMLANNPTIQMPGMLPYLGSKLNVNYGVAFLCRPNGEHHRGRQLGEHTGVISDIVQWARSWNFGMKMVGDGGENERSAEDRADRWRESSEFITCINWIGD